MKLCLYKFAGGGIMEEIEHKEESIKDLFEEELNLLHEHTLEADQLYKETYEHFTAIKESNSRNTLSFIKDQTENLISLKHMKLQSIKERINIKKTMFDLDLKQNKNTDVGTADAILINSIVQQLNQNNNQLIMNNVAPEVQLDDIIEQYERDGILEYSAHEKKITEEKELLNVNNPEALLKKVLAEHVEETNKDN